jgi:hypothetical protein
MHYLGNNHVGFDALALGFPSIKGCQAVIYHVKAGLFGCHDMKSGAGFSTAEAVTTGKATAFANWVSKHANGSSPGVALYGVVNRNEQYQDDTAGNAEWDAMLIEVADKLRFDGSIYGARVNSHVKQGDSIYVVAEVQGNDCHIKWKRWEKMKQVAGSEHSHADQAVLRRQSIATGAFNTVGLPDDPNEDAKTVARKKAGKSENLNLFAVAQMRQIR